MAYRKFNKFDKDAVQLYLKEIAKIPLIPVEKEHELGTRIQATGDPEAINQLVKANLKFVVSYSKKYKDGPLSMADLIEEGNLGLIEAAKRFDPNRGVKFITYAAWWIRQSIIHAMGEQGRTIRIPQRQSNLLYQLGKHFNELKTTLHRNPTIEELARDMEISVKATNKLLNLRSEDLSLDAKVDKNQEIELKDLITEENEEPVDIALIRESLKMQVHEIIDQLNPRERHVIQERFGLNEAEESKTLQVIGDELGVTRERVRQIEQHALDKLRRNAKSRRLQTFLN
jgi:RNA polymerase primary sigma factor